MKEFSLRAQVIKEGDSSSLKLVVAGNGFSDIEMLGILARAGNEILKKDGIEKEELKDEE